MSQQPSTCEKPEHLKSSPQDCSPEQITKCHGSGQKHTCLDEQEMGILSKMKEILGSVPGPLVVMSKKQGVLSDFMKYGKGLFEGGPLNDRERFLVALSAATALKSPYCINSHSKRALKAGATEEEIIQTMLIAGMLGNTSMLHTAYDAVDFINTKTED
ncbi:MAG: carboxymuconolactone decarboxylase family protein [Candidatus Latescibacteria bacterium]|nr:carboxymuconolactone decarboxylase family protein [Candidatus Latescibacterota bacterium]